MPLILVLLVVAVFVVKFAWILAAFAAAAAVGWAVGCWLARRDDQVQARRRRDAEICERADLQHSAYLAGDLRVAVYGNYPPSA